jgi:DNA-directed RNA polymerase alpha subunit
MNARRLFEVSLLTLSDMEKLKLHLLLATDGLGEKGITEIKKALSDLGLTLKA